MRSHAPLTSDGVKSPVRVGKDMRMPSDHLAGNRLDHVAEGERVLFLRHPGMEHHLQQEVAEFVTQIIEIATCNGVDDFVGFLDGVGSNGREILFEIPGTAAAGRSQRRHDFEQP